MSEGAVRRLGGVVIGLTAIVFVIGGFVVAFNPFEGDRDAIAGGFYYAGLVLSVLALPALHASLDGRGGVTALVGFSAAQVGAVLYGTGAFLVLPLVADIAGAHDVFLFAAAEVPVFPVGALLFFTGSATLGFVIAAKGAVSRAGGLLYAVGALMWLIAFFAPPAINTKTLFAANITAGVGATMLALRLIGLKISSRVPAQEPAPSMR